jgi:ABC-2 type transport system permease protein
LLTGKLVAMGVAGLFQAGVWVLLGGLLYRLLGAPTGLPPGLSLTPSVLAWSVAFSLLGYAVYAALFAGAGALVPDWRKSPQASLVLSLPAIIGFQIGIFTVDNPHGALAIAASLFPLTAPMIVVKRLVVGGVPPWQLWLSAGGMVLSIPLLVRAVARVFRAQHLLSGQPFSAKRYLRVLLGRG